MLAGVVPYTIVWGDRLTSRSQLVAFEGVSIALNAVFLSIALMKSGLLRARIPETTLKVALVVMGALSLLNTIGNLVSSNSIEPAVFTPITLLISVLCFMAARRQNPGQRQIG